MAYLIVREKIVSFKLFDNLYIILFSINLVFIEHFNNSVLFCFHLLLNKGVWLILMGYVATEW